MRHKIICTNSIGAPHSCVRLIKKAIRTALAVEGVERACTVGLLMTDNEGIREINAQMRDKDAVTDVLSFPALEITAGEQPQPDEFSRERHIYLGDMTINIDRAREQAEEFGHSISRECAYLAVHSTLHLLGYDHLDEAEQKAQMRLHEERVMTKLGLPRR